jgi:hypothetical protein
MSVYQRMLQVQVPMPVTGQNHTKKPIFQVERTGTRQTILPWSLGLKASRDCEMIAQSCTREPGVRPPKNHEK